MRFDVRRSAIAFVLALAVGLAGCGGSDNGTPTDPPGNGGGNGSGGPGANEVHVQDNSFNPSSLTVAPGTTVTWTWVGNDFHDVAWTSGDLPSSSLQSSGTHTVTMPEEPGEYTYICNPHVNLGMTGTIIVEEVDNDD